MMNVFTIPPDVPFVDALAAGLWEQTGRDPLLLAEMRVYLPTRRACRYLREAFVRVVEGRAALLPRMQPLGDADETEDELVFTGGAEALDMPPAISPLRRQMLLTQLIVKKDKSLPLDQAAEMAAALGRLLDQVQRERGDFANLEKLVPDNYAEHWKQTLMFLEIVTSAWPDVLKAEKAVDPAERLNRALEAQAKVWRLSPPSYPVIAAGSTASVPVVAEWLAVVAGMPKGRVVLPGLDLGLDEAAWQAIGESHPQYGMKNWLEKAAWKRRDVKIWPTGKTLRVERVRLLQEAMRPAEETVAWRTLDPAVISKKAFTGLTRVEADQQQEEADVIALRLRAVLEEPGKTAVLATPDRALAERVAAGLRRWGIAANDSAGASLAALPLGSFLRGVLQAASPEASAIDYLSLLKHPLTACGLEPSECRRRARRIEVAIWRGVCWTDGWRGAARALRHDKETRSLGLWIENLAQAFKPVLSAWKKKLSLEERLRQHIDLAERLAATHEFLGSFRLWQGEAGETAVAWLDDWRQSAGNFPPLKGNEYMRLFAPLMRGVPVRPAFGQHPRLSILGLLEARLQHADLVILGGLNEGTWPPEAEVDPWMSRPMKKEFGLPLPERRIGLSAHDFVQLASASEVMLTRARRVEGSPTVPSRFLMQLEAVLQALGYHSKENDALAPQEPWLDWARRLDEPQETKPCAPPRPCPPLEVRPRQLSVTEIGTWLRNPYAIYARHILGLKRLEPIDADVTVAERGIIIHKALEKFLNRFRNTWPSAPLEALLAAGREVFAPYEDQPQIRAFWWPRFERIAAWFVATEEKRRQTGMLPIGVEAEGEMFFANGSFKLKGRADRIDKLPDGSVTIIDYKTGTLPSNKEINLGYEPQLLLLALIMEAGGFKDFGPLRVSDLSYWGLKGGRADETVKPIEGDIAARMRRARETLEDLVKGFTDSSAPYEVVPKPQFAPKYDDYAHLARLAEWGRTGDEP